jgi:hypothetical protein
LRRQPPSALWSTPPAGASIIGDAPRPDAFRSAIARSVGQGSRVRAARERSPLPHANTMASPAKIKPARQALHQLMLGRLPRAPAPRHRLERHLVARLDVAAAPQAMR